MEKDREIGYTTAVEPLDKIKHDCIVCLRMEDLWE